MCLETARLLCRPTISRQLLQLMCRQSRNKSNSAAATAAINNVLTTDDYPLLLTEEQRQRCIEEMRKLPAFPRSKPNAQHKQETREASVLIALCLERDTKDISLLYTRRSRHLRSHGLQMSFPGGKRDETDDSFIDCALRETEEEIGLPRERVQIWGEGSPITLPRASTIVPVVGVVTDFHVSQLHINHDEVEEAFSIPLNSLISPTAMRHTQFRGGYSGPVFIVDRNRIWGITGYLTYMFLRCLLPTEMLPVALKTNLKFIRPYKLSAKLTPKFKQPLTLKVNK